MVDFECYCVDIGFIVDDGLFSVVVWCDVCIVREGCVVCYCECGVVVEC